MRRGGRGVEGPDFGCHGCVGRTFASELSSLVSLFRRKAVSSRPFKAIEEVTSQVHSVWFIPSRMARAGESL